MKRFKADLDDDNNKNNDDDVVDLTADDDVDNKTMDATWMHPSNRWSLLPSTVENSSSSILNNNAIENISSSTTTQPPFRVGAFQNPIGRVLVSSTGDVLCRGFYVPECEQRVTRSVPELILPLDLQEAVLFTFDCQFDVLVEEFGHVLTYKSDGARRIHVMSNSFPNNAQGDTKRLQCQAMFQAQFDVSFPQAKITLLIHPTPPVPMFGCFHPKCWLLFYPHGFRCIIQTSNTDQPSPSNLCELMWYQDFPLKSALSPIAPDNINDFESVLADLVENVLPNSVGRALKSRLNLHDFSSAEVALVVSRPNGGAAWSGSDAFRFGLGRLESLLRLAEDSIPADWPCVVQCSSIGKQTSKSSKEGPWIQVELGRAMRGAKAIPKNLKIIAISESEVMEMRKTQPGAGGSTFFSALKLKKYTSTGREDVYGDDEDHVEGFFERQNVWTWTPPPQSLQSRVFAAPHCKTLTRYNPNAPRELAWFVLGSHNASAAAYGGWTSQARDKLLMRSFELSILFSPVIYSRAGRRRYSVEKKTYEQVFPENLDMDSLTFVADKQQFPLEILIPVPYRLPGNEYRPEDKVWNIQADFDEVQ